MVAGALFSLLSGLAIALFVPPEALAEIEAGMAQAGTGDARPLAYDTPYLVSVLYRVSLWVAVTPFAALTMAPLPILLGWLAARRRILDEPWRHRTLLRRVAVGGVAIGWLGGLPEALAVAGVLPLPAAAPWMLTALTSLTGVACGAGYAAAFGLLALRLEGRRAARRSAPSPRRSGRSASPRPRRCRRAARSRGPWSACSRRWAGGR